MAKKRIVVTGMGVVSCFGNDVDTFYASLKAGKSGAGPISKFNTEAYPTRIAAEVKEFDASAYVDKKLSKRADPYITYTIVAGKKSLEMAQLGLEQLEALNKDRCGILLGSGMGGMHMFCDNVKTLESLGPKRVSPFLIPYIITNMGGALLGIDLGFRGPNYSISTACSTANYAIISAANHIRNGEADLMICGGVEAAILPIGVAGFCSIKALSQRNDQPEQASRPWDKNRDGFLIGEGAGALVLESLEHARKRNAPILAEYLGGGISCDAYHMTDLSIDGVALCLSNTLKDAGITYEQVNFINAHATSTPAGDMNEIAALKRVFPNSREIVINATKSMTGHCLGAAGGIEAVATIKGIQEGIVHPTLNLLDPEEGLDFIAPTKAMQHQIKVAISNSFGFGGHNATIALAPFKDE